jgi:hypothetical protein
LEFREDAAKGDDVIESVGLTVGEMQEVARRQLRASLAAAVLIAVVAALLALTPHSKEVAIVPVHDFKIVRHPSFEKTGRDVAAVRNTKEAP